MIRDYATKKNPGPGRQAGRQAETCAHQLPVPGQPWRKQKKRINAAHDTTRVKRPRRAHDLLLPPPLSSPASSRRRPARRASVSSSPAQPNQRRAGRRSPGAEPAVCLGRSKFWRPRRRSGRVHRSRDSQFGTEKNAGETILALLLHKYSRTAIRRPYEQFCLCGTLGSDRNLGLISPDE
jgi:hypothetical protein